MATYEIHISDVRSFLSCRRKWSWSSPLRRGLEPNVPYAPFFTGRAFHYALEHYYRDNVDPLFALGHFLEEERKLMEQGGSLWPQEEDVVQEQIDLLIGMLSHYKLWVGSDAGRWNDKNLRFLALETNFRVPLRTMSGRASNKVCLAGRMDGVVQLIDDGTYWIWESKTTRSIEELKRSLVNDNQAGAYIYAAQQMFNVPISGVLYNICRKKVPTYPAVVTSGLLTRRMDIDTTAQAYLDAIHTHHPDYDDESIREFYGDILEHLLEKGNTFFARVPITRSPLEILQLQYDIHLVAKEMTNERTAIYPNPSWLNCGFCHFRAPCLALNAGSDYEFLLQEEYRERIPYSIDDPEPVTTNGGIHGKTD